MTAPHPRGLWHHRSFLYLWVAQTVSAAGSAVTAIALPLTAVLYLDASPAEMGLLGAAAGLPALLFGLLVGVWVDRARRHTLMIVADLGRALLLASIPAAALLGLLTMAQLYAVAFCVGTLSLFFDIAVTSYLPSVVRREELVDANGKLQMSDSVTAVAGPGVAGLLVQLATAPAAIALDALSFLASALLLRRIPSEEPAAPVRRGGRSIRGELGEGLRFLVAEPLLRSMTLSSALGSLALSVQGAVLVLYATEELRIAPALLGAIFSARGAASLLGAALSGRVGRTVGAGPAVVWGTLLSCLGALTYPLAAGSPVAAAAFLVAGQVLFGLGTPIYSVNQVSLRQEITPDRLLGRVNAGRRFVVFGVAPVGALVGGTLGSQLGLRPALITGAACMVLAFLVALLSPLRTAVQRGASAAGV